MVTNILFIALDKRGKLQELGNNKKAFLDKETPSQADASDYNKMMMLNESQSSLHKESSIN